MRILGIAILLLGLCAGGCASYTANVEPGTSVAGFQYYWVKTNLDDNHGLAGLIVQQLRKRGFEADAGPLTMMPRDVQAIVSYRDHWAWDFKNHMTGLQISVREATSERQVAVANFVGPASLTARPLDVVDRLIQELIVSRTVVMEVPL
jgi:hypothetical protein